MKDHEILDNRASLEPDTAENVTCDNCANPLIFAMQDNYHKLSPDLLTILECLSIAENQGAVPRLPDTWWLEIWQCYNI